MKEGMIYQLFAKACRESGCAIKPSNDLDVIYKFTELVIKECGKVADSEEWISNTLALNRHFGIEERNPTKAWISCDIRPVDSKPVWVYDPKPSVEYGPDVHKAYWDSNEGKWIGADEDIDPFDINPSVWFCEDLSLIEMKDQKGSTNEQATQKLRSGSQEIC